MEMEHGRLRSHPAPTADMEYLLVVDGVQEDMVTSGTSSGNWSCTPITDYFSYANRLWTVGSGDVTGIVYGTCDSCLTSPPSPPTTCIVLTYHLQPQYLVIHRLQISFNICKVNC